MNELEQARTEIEVLLQDLRAEMSDYLIPDALQEQLNDELTEAERLLAETQAYANALAARDRAQKAQQIFRQVFLSSEKVTTF